MVRDLIDLEEKITRLREDFKKLSEEQKDRMRKDRIAKLTTWLIQNGVEEEELTSENFNKKKEKKKKLLCFAKILRNLVKNRKIG